MILNNSPKKWLSGYALFLSNILQSKNQSPPPWRGRGDLFESFDLSVVDNPKWLITQLRLLLSCLALILPLCAAGQARGETILSGTISANYTLSLANSPFHVTGDVTVANSAILTIEPGVTITFDGGTSMLVNGALTAQGTIDSPITFTASAASPVAGSWGNLIIQDGGNATLNHCTIRYAGSRSGYNYGAILKGGGGSLTVTASSIDTFYTYGIVLNNAGGTVTISNTLIDGKNNYNGNHGILATGLSSAANITISGNTITNAYTNGILLQNGAAPHINGNTFSNNAGYAILVNSGAAPVLDAANQFSPPASGWEMGFDAPSSGIAHTYDNALTVPVVITGGTIASPNSVTWSSSRTYLVATAVTVNSGASLSIAPGSIVKLGGGVSIQVNGSFVAGSDSGGRSYFTGFKDTTIGAVVKGVSGTPAAGEWGNIAVNNNGNATIANCDIRYAGSASGYSYGAIIKYGAGGLTLSHSTIYSAYTHGVRLQDTTATASISGNTIQAVGYYGNYGLTLNNAGSGVTISGNTITGASTAGISVSGATSTPQIIKNSITGNTVGISAAASANPVIGGLLGNGNNLYNNSTWSLQNATATSPPLINARFNYWGGQPDQQGHGQRGLCQLGISTLRLDQHQQRRGLYHPGRRDHRLFMQRHQWL